MVFCFQNLTIAVQSAGNEIYSKVKKDRIEGIYGKLVDRYYAHKNQR